MGMRIGGRIRRAIGIMGTRMRIGIMGMGMRIGGGRRIMGMRIGGRRIIGTRISGRRNRIITVMKI